MKAVLYARKSPYRKRADSNGDPGRNGPCIGEGSQRSRARA